MNADESRDTIEPERHLLIAIIERAYQDLAIIDERELHRPNAIKWLKSTERGPWSLRWCLEMIGWPYRPEAIDRMIEETAEIKAQAVSGAERKRAALIKELESEISRLKSTGISQLDLFAAAKPIQRARKNRALFLLGEKLRHTRWRLKRMKEGGE